MQFNTETQEELQRYTTSRWISSETASATHPGLSTAETCLTMPLVGGYSFVLSHQVENICQFRGVYDRKARRCQENPHKGLKLHRQAELSL